MDYQYLAYTSQKKLVKGKIAAPDENKAIGQLSSMGYQVLSIKTLGWLNKLRKSLDISLTAQVKPKEVVMFSRQLAILLESGIDIVTAIDLYKTQVSNKIFRRILEEVIADLRGGTSLSGSLSKHPSSILLFKVLQDYSVVPLSFGTRIPPVPAESATDVPAAIPISGRFVGIMIIRFAFFEISCMMFH